MVSSGPEKMLQVPFILAEVGSGPRRAPWVPLILLEMGSQCALGAKKRYECP